MCTTGDQYYADNIYVKTIFINFKTCFRVTRIQYRLNDFVFSLSLDDHLATSATVDYKHYVMV